MSEDPIVVIRPYPYITCNATVTSPYICYCGHALDEHGCCYPGKPMDTSCGVEGCDCICYERDPEASQSDAAVKHA
jgi:hypothetical protein